MQFLFNDIELKLNPIATSETYLQKITSEVFLNGKRSVNSSQKTLNVEVIKKENQLIQVKIKSTNHSIKLDNLLKTQEDITLKMASLTDNVLLKIDTNGAINAIDNHFIIKQKWEALKQELGQLYEGNTAEIYFLGLDNKINNSKKLILDFQQNRLFGLLWNGVYSSYSNDKSIIKERTKTICNVVEHIPISVDETIFCERIDRNKNEITLRLNGELNSGDTFIKKIEHHFIRNGGSRTAKFELTAYEGVLTINTNSGLLKEASLLIETKFGNSYKKKDQFNIHNIV